MITKSITTLVGINYLLIEVKDNADFLRAKVGIINHMPSGKKNDWSFLKHYWPAHDVCHFTHLGVGKDGNVFPTTVKEGISPMYKVCNIEEIEQYIPYFGFETPELEPTTINEILYDYSESGELDISKFENCITYLYPQDVATIRIELLNRLLNVAERENILNYAPIVTELVCNKWLEFENRKKLFEENLVRLVGKDIPVTEIKDAHVRSEVKQSFTNQEILNILREFSFSEDHHKVCKLHCYLFDALDGRNGHETYKILLGSMLIDGGRDRSNLLQFYPVWTLIYNNEWVNLP